MNLTFQISLKGHANLIKENADLKSKLIEQERKKKAELALGKAQIDQSEIQSRKPGRFSVSTSIIRGGVSQSSRADSQVARNDFERELDLWKAR